ILGCRKGVGVIGLMKSNRKIAINGKTYMANTVPDIKRKLIKRSTKFKCRYIQINIVYQDIEMRGYWVQMKGQNTWKLLISTDRKLSFIKAMRYYQNRWSIEVFFKDCKQNLGLNDCHSTDFDAHVANTSVVFMNYMALALKKRFDDYETIGGLFRNLKNTMVELTLVAKIWKFLMEVFIPVLADFGLDWEEFTRKTIRDTDRVLSLPEKLNRAWAGL
ncbi:MAG: transposase, partial [Taibaiella sp.]|nr:transposase [Taibaiella sp.]